MRHTGTLGNEGLPSRTGSLQERSRHGDRRLTRPASQHQKVRPVRWGPPATGETRRSTLARSGIDQEFRPVLSPRGRSRRHARRSRGRSAAGSPPMSVPERLRDLPRARRRCGIHPDRAAPSRLPAIRGVPRRPVGDVAPAGERTGICDGAPASRTPTDRRVAPGRWVRPAKRVAVGAPDRVATAPSSGTCGRCSPEGRAPSRSQPTPSATSRPARSPRCRGWRSAGRSPRRCEAPARWAC